MVAIKPKGGWGELGLCVTHVFYTFLLLEFFGLALTSRPHCAPTIIILVEGPNVP